MAPPKILFLGIFALIFLIRSEAQQTFQFSSFSQIPQSLLNQLGSAQIENLKQQLNQGGGGGGNGGGGDIPTFQAGGPRGGGGGQGQTLQFSSFSQIPQSVLDTMTSQQVEQIKQALKGNGGGGDVQTYQIGGGGSPGTQPGQQQTFQFSSFSQIPQSLLDQLTSSQISNIKRELTPQQVPQQQTYQQFPQNTQTLQFSSFSQIPQSVLDQFTSDQIQQIRIALQQGGGTVQLPATVTTYSYTLPGGNNRRVNNALNTIFNYVAAGGYLTGIPPVDLLLIRYYISMGPQKFCG